MKITAIPGDDLLEEYICGLVSQAYSVGLSYPPVKYIKPVFFPVREYKRVLIHVIENPSDIIYSGNRFHVMRRSP